MKVDFSIKTYSEYLGEILKHCGVEAQKRKLQEECAELIRAIARNDEYNMLEEMADVLLLLEQFQICPEYAPRILNVLKKMKIKRTLERIEAEKTPCLGIDCLGCTCTDDECRMNK